MRRSEARTCLETPCVNICVIDEGRGLCTGCGRTRYEIACWTSMTPDERRAVMAALPGRLAAISGR